MTSSCIRSIGHEFARLSRLQSAPFSEAPLGAFPESPYYSLRYRPHPDCLERAILALLSRCSLGEVMVCCGGKEGFGDEEGSPTFVMQPCPIAFQQPRPPCDSTSFPNLAPQRAIFLFRYSRSYRIRVCGTAMSATTSGTATPAEGGVEGARKLKILMLHGLLLSSPFSVSVHLLPFGLFLLQGTPSIQTSSKLFRILSSHCCPTQNSHLSPPFTFLHQTPC